MPKHNQCGFFAKNPKTISAFTAGFLGLFLGLTLGYCLTSPDHINSSSSANMSPAARRTGTMTLCGFSGFIFFLLIGAQIPKAIKKLCTCCQKSDSLPASEKTASDLEEPAPASGEPGPAWT